VTISNYQVNSVIKTYVKNMKTRVRTHDPEVQPEARDDSVQISEEGMKRMLFERIGEQVNEKLRRYNHEG
jgi:hypothetical protein